ncbi:3-oxoadipyl-CoA thiolase [Ensifer sp. ENS10]|uniref:3-oxoadipyl-CoA thiolase n=1 Tax=unclassified Ensifer TaxID=2633371 RepID=UPI00070CA296|nr:MULTISPECIES: 3-oxoadipyl-CoA thiolase [unclassified Ensifer]KRD49325.1 beta-ketoadipyl CoA thiolase [Ensifer sp. Root278]MBD9510586.1 3-oxoadipyl-CoA thiolase [Ensifer sp. ENS10]MBV7517788.1 3-oxoadipyl-CoA thiolase [Ensifer sp. ENS12]
MGEAYIVGGVRTPIGRYGGALSSARPDDLAAHVIREALARVSSVPTEAIDEVVLGCANQAGEDNRNVARMAALLAGLPETAAGTTINRLCGSGLDAVGYAARAIRLGEAEIIVAGGVESMSRAPFVMPKAESPFQRSTEIHDTTIGWRFVNPVMKTQYGIDSMPETAENVATEFSISREDQDGFALRSQARAATAQKSGRFAREIAPYAIKARKGETTCVEQDEHPRETTIEKLASLPTPFRANGTVTAGNASGVNDGAAALILASGQAVERYGLKPLARVDGMATAGVPPRIMGIGPVFSTRKLLERLRLDIGDIDIVELNEAFAAQALACMRQLGLADDASHVNPNGGAIALGHPLGMSGARLALTAALELEEHGAKRAIATMCIGVGQGISMLLTRP